MRRDADFRFDQLVESGVFDGYAKMGQKNRRDLDYFIRSATGPCRLQIENNIDNPFQIYFNDVWDSCYGERNWGRGNGNGISFNLGLWDYRGDRGRGDDGTSATVVPKTPTSAAFARFGRLSSNRNRGYVGRGHDDGDIAL